MSGSPVLLVHGFGTSFKATWQNNGWTDLLTEAGRDVIGVDLLGHGTAPRPSNPEAYRDLENLILAELPEEPVDAISFSAGAMAVLWLASHHPSRFNRLVVAGVGSNIFEGSSQRGEQIAAAVRTGQANDPELRYFADLPESDSADPNDRSALAAFLERPDRRQFTPELLGRISSPVLVVLGDRDFAGPADPLVNALSDAQERVLRNVDHFATPKDMGFLDAALTFIDAQPF